MVQGSQAEAEEQSEGQRREHKLLRGITAVTGGSDTTKRSRLVWTEIDLGDCGTILVGWWEEEAGEGRKDGGCGTVLCSAGLEPVHRRHEAQRAAAPEAACRRAARGSPGQSGRRRSEDKPHPLGQGSATFKT